jgi:hypothetical protein
MPKAHVGERFRDGHRPTGKETIQVVEHGSDAGAASKAGMDIKTAGKYLRAKVLPSELKADRHWRTHKDEFSCVAGS